MSLASSDVPAGDILNQEFLANKHEWGAASPENFIFGLVRVCSQIHGSNQCLSEMRLSEVLW